MHRRAKPVADAVRACIPAMGGGERWGASACIRPSRWPHAVRGCACVLPDVWAAAGACRDGTSHLAVADGVEEGLLEDLHAQRARHELYEHSMRAAIDAHRGARAEHAPRTNDEFCVFDTCSTLVKVVMKLHVTLMT